MASSALLRPELSNITPELGSEMALAIKMLSKGVVVDLIDIIKCEEAQDLFVIRGNMIAAADGVSGFCGIKIRLTYPTLSKLRSLIKSV
jgi:hypothetical protein